MRCSSVATQKSARKPKNSVDSKPVLLSEYRVTGKTDKISPTNFNEKFRYET